jgi:hypothetical protein
MMAEAHVSHPDRTLLGRMRAGRFAAKSLTRSMRLPLRILLGRLLLLALLLVIPVFNPAVYRAGDERLYLGTVIVLAAAALMLPSLRDRRFSWIAAALLLAVLYVLETALLRGELSLGIAGNSYRPLHPMLVFCASAVLLFTADRTRWLRIFLAGGLAGCFLAVLNTIFPGVDPFAVSRPEDLGWYGESKFVTSERQAGAFIYPGNFGPYAAYVALAALVALEKARLRLFSTSLYTFAFFLGALGILVSGSRAAALGVVTGSVVVMWRSSRFRFPLIATAAVGSGLLIFGAWVAGVLGEIVESRVFQADLSIRLRLEAWRAGWEPFLDNPLFGGGVIPNTIDSVLFYYLGVGGLVGLALVLAMYWSTLLRPLRRRDWSSLPIIVAVLAIGITQDSFGQPLASWAFAIAIFLVSSPPSELERRRDEAASSREPEPACRREGAGAASS